METEKQRTDFGRSRGRKGRKKRQENRNYQEKQSNHNQENGQLGKKIAVAAGATVLTAAVVAGIVYAIMGQKYKQVYFPNTTVNGLDVSGLTPDEVKRQITEETSGYMLTITERGGETETIQGEAIDLHPEFDGTLEQIIENQSTLAWGFHIGRYVDYTIDTMAAFDTDKLTQVVSQLTCLSPERVVAPQNAYISDYISGTGYEIIPEEQGQSPDSTLLYEAIRDGILNFQESLSLEDAGVYEKPQITAEDEGLKAELEAWNKYVHTRVTYRFGSKSEVLDGEKIHEWLVSDGQGGVNLDESKIGEYVAGLAQTYNTVYKPKTFKTSYGQTVTISKSVYGWKINQAEETSALKQLLLSCESQEREPVYSQTAASRDGNDYGNTYAEINLTAQHMFFYKDGKKVVESDFVSGNESRGWSTPAGVYPLTYKQRNATLKGANYSTPVSYWMPFNGGIGMHDAYWRSSFGGKIYKTNGSHGCINLPPAVAKTVYENISAGMPVICYHLDGTGSGTSSTSSQNGETETKAQATQQTTAAETKAQQSAGSGQSAAHSTAAAQQETKAAQPTTAAQQETKAAQQTSAAQPTAAAKETTAAVPTTAAAQPQPVQQPGVSSSPAGAGAAQSYPGQNNAAQNSPSSNTSSAPGVSPSPQVSGPGN